MNITLSSGDKLVKEIRKLAVERAATRTGLVRERGRKCNVRLEAAGARNLETQL
jgi:hypothetical protein